MKEYEIYHLALPRRQLVHRPLNLSTNLSVLDSRERQLPVGLLVFESELFNGKIEEKAPPTMLAGGASNDGEKPGFQLRATFKARASVENL